MASRWNGLEGGGARGGRGVSAGFEVVCLGASGTYPVPGAACSGYLLRADGKLIILGEEGYLALATADENGVKVVSKFKPLEDKAWTVPTLVNTRLYLRDNQNIMAYEIGATALD